MTPDYKHTMGKTDWDIVACLLEISFNSDLLILKNIFARKDQNDKSPSICYVMLQFGEDIEKKNSVNKFRYSHVIIIEKLAYENFD